MYIKDGDQSDGSMQKICNSSASALELHLFCIKPSILGHNFAYVTLAQLS